MSDALFCGIMSSSGFSLAGASRRKGRTARPSEQRRTEQSGPGQDRCQPPAQQAIHELPAVMDFDMSACAVDQMCVVDLDRAG